MGKSNQKTVKVEKEPCDKNNFYTAINLDALNYSASVLSGDGFKMLVYFSKNRPGYEFELSSKHAEETFLLSKRRYDNAIKELAQAGFLVDTNTDPDEVKNSWTFYERPLNQNDNKPLQQSNTRLVEQEYRPSPPVDTRNNTDNINNKIENSWFDNMTDQEKKDYFTKNIF